MGKKELEQFKEAVRRFDANHRTKELCLQSLREEGIVGADGRLAPPYRDPEQE